MVRNESVMRSGYPLLALTCTQFPLEFERYSVVGCEGGIVGTTVM